MKDQEKFVNTCNMCSEIMEMRYHCTICDDYDLCLKCFSQNGHRYKMEKQEFAMMEAISATSSTRTVRTLSPAKSRTQHRLE